MLLKHFQQLEEKLFNCFSIMEMGTFFFSKFRDNNKKSISLFILMRKFLKSSLHGKFYKVFE
jgi:hypothetical protein